MAFSPFRRRARISRRGIVALAGFALLVLQIVLAQKGRRPSADKGPRAVGLLEFGPNGKAHLIPVTIMIDGKFYDASAYKAAPVPLALESGTVYEAMRSGVSEGLFTVKGATTGVTTWRGEGTWQSADQIKAAAARKKAMQVAEKAESKKEKEDQDAPPVLHRRASAPQPDKTTPQPQPKSTASDSASSTASANPPSAASAAPPKSSASIPDDDENDPDRPRLRRTKSAPDDDAESSPPPAPPAHSSQPSSGHRPAYGPMPVAAKATTVSKAASISPAAVQLIPAVSDAAGPDPRPYTYDMKPDEEVTFRNKMLALATIAVRDHVKLVSSETTPTTASGAPSPIHKRPAAKPPQPTFDDVQLHVFDLSNSNEPVLILTAKAHLPLTRAPLHESKENAAANASPFLITLVAREDIYGDLHKALANVTDSEHLDVLPRLDLIDAVDVDGDGRGELLFRRVSDAGSGYVVYRVIGNQLWPLFEGAIS